MSYWNDWLRDRFADREALTRNEVKRLFWADLPSEAVDEFFDFFELEYSAPAGLLRPNDDLSRLTRPIRTKNPLRWFAVEPGLEDSASELSHQVWNRARSFGLSHELPVQTIGDCVRVWCGQPPVLRALSQPGHGPVAE